MTVRGHGLVAFMIKQGECEGGTKMRCPRCENLLVVQRPSTSPLDRLLSLLSIYPFQCQACMHRFRARQEEPRESTGVAERRQVSRTPVRIPVRFESGEGLGEGVITDISEGGCALESKRRFRPGLLLRLQLPAGTDEEPDRTVPQLGSVRSAHGNRAGVQFVALTPQKQLQLTHTITRAIRMLPTHNDEAQPP
jgi:hypothetical protein